MKSNILLLASSIIFISLCSCRCHPGSQEGKKAFNYSKYLIGQTPSLFAYVKSVDYDTGKVVIAGGCKQKSKTLFTWQWGDGSTQEGLFPQEHIYADLTRNYTVRVISHHSGDQSDTAETFVRFVAPEIVQKTLPANIAISIPDSMVKLESRMPKEEMYEFSKNLTYFEDAFFPVIPREKIGYILSVAASIQMELVNNDVYRIDGGFRQVMLRDGPFRGMYSLWYTNPVSFGVGDYGFQGTIQWSSFFHEMGHNFTLNTPAHYYFGGKTDGNANAVYSETMAQIFQHVTAYQIINNYKKYGLSADLAYEIRLSANASFFWEVTSYNRYISSGKNFSTWNDPNSQQDETSGVFMTIAYKFFEHAEREKADYCTALKRMMSFLQNFNEDWHRRYEPDKDSVEGESFRATMMVSALSYAFDKDLRPEFKDLNFPVNDDVYLELLASTN